MEEKENQDFAVFVKKKGIQHGNCKYWKQMILENIWVRKMSGLYYCLVFLVYLACQMGNS